MYDGFIVHTILKNNKKKGYVSGYINATKLCALVGKKFKHWMENRDSKKSIDAVSRLGKTEHNVTVTINMGSNWNYINGTYVHPDLIPSILSWTDRDCTKPTTGYVYCITSDIINFVKIGYWTSSLKSLRKRYVTCYGRNITVHSFEK